MRVISETSDKEIARRKAMRGVRSSVRLLAANLMRVMRGAGKPDEIEQQAIDLFEAIAAHRAAADCPPSAFELTRALDISYSQELLAKLNDGNRAMARSEERIVRGSLQTAASRLLGQRTQEAAGETEVTQGIRDRKEAIDEINRDAGRPRAVDKPKGYFRRTGLKKGQEG